MRSASEKLVGVGKYKRGMESLECSAKQLLRRSKNSKEFQVKKGKSRNWTLKFRNKFH